MNERKRDYSTASENGMEFIANRWVFAGPKGYRVVFNGDGTTENDWAVYSYAGSSTRLVYNGCNLTEDAAHELAARLANTTPHPKPTEVEA